MGKLQKFLCFSCCDPERGEVYEVSRAVNPEDSPPGILNPPEAAKGQIHELWDFLSEGHIDSIVEPHDFNPPFSSTKVHDDKQNHTSQSFSEHEQDSVTTTCPDSSGFCTEEIPSYPNDASEIKNWSCGQAGNGDADEISPAAKEDSPHEEVDVCERTMGQILSPEPTVSVLTPTSPFEENIAPIVEVLEQHDFNPTPTPIKNDDPYDEVDPVERTMEQILSPCKSSVLSEDDIDPIVAVVEQHDFNSPSTSIKVGDDKQNPTSIEDDSNITICSDRSQTLFHTAYPGDSSEITILGNCSVLYSPPSFTIYA